MSRFVFTKRKFLPQCDHKLNLKKHFLSDFYIGGFASAKCSAILTRDRGCIQKIFSQIARI